MSTPTTIEFIFNDNADDSWNVNGSLTPNPTLYLNTNIVYKFLINPVTPGSRSLWIVTEDNYYNDENAFTDGLIINNGVNSGYITYIPTDNDPHLLWYSGHVAESVGQINITQGNPIKSFEVGTADENLTINGVERAHLFLLRGVTYTFSMGDGLGEGFYFRIMTDESPWDDGVGGNAYTGEDLPVNNVNSGPNITWTIGDDTPSLLYWGPGTPGTSATIYIANPPPSTDIPCYSKGTMILTNKGYTKIEDIKKGDIVVREGSISNNGILEKNIIREVPVIWVNKFKPKLLDTLSRPICIKKNAFGEDQPFEDLYVSPNHSIMIDDRLTTAKDLKNGDTIYMDTECESVEYYHLECETHSAIYANGVLSETYLEWKKEIFDVIDYMR